VQGEGHGYIPSECQDVRRFRRRRCEEILMRGEEEEGGRGKDGKESLLKVGDGK